MDDLAIFNDDNLIERFEMNTLSYLDLLYKAIDKNCSHISTRKDNMLYYHRLERLKEKLPEAKLYEILPAVLTRDYYLEIIGRTSMEIKRMRHIKSKEIGKLVKFRGIVTKSTATKPFARVCTYICDSCGSETYVETFSETFDLLEECISEKCREKKMKGSLNLQIRGSTFSKFQKLKIQEIMAETIYGSVPISLDVECYDSLVDRVRPDPGISKSQLLKEAIRLCDGIYTTGYGSSSAGLTAAVTKDSATGEPVLEGGALVLADNSVCAIDEFDKMSESDRTSVHEVMEQHTVSISKAGINATLNARTSILAAANPLGTFNKKLSLSKNLNMPVSLLSRFDAIFIIQDIPDRDTDKLLAEHIFPKKLYGIRSEAMILCASDKNNNIEAIKVNKIPEGTSASLSGNLKPLIFDFKKPVLKIFDNRIQEAISGLHIKNNTLMFLDKIVTVGGEE
ncbi:DNA replication licensing factor mcm7-A-like, partial [Lepeophtheirus salmonis]|uniref:DNA replication licensing factor mcm7-A-like n=1 Tax=Lepeophtheirus salmonis TaxID=72036 RepID=UPI001AE90F22